jgi:hypothetical protein
MKQHISCRVSTLTFEQALKEAFKNTAPVIATIMTAEPPNYICIITSTQRISLTCINIIDDDLPWKGKPGRRLLAKDTNDPCHRSPAALRKRR